MGFGQDKSGKMGLGSFEEIYYAPIPIFSFDNIPVKGISVG